MSVTAVYNIKGKLPISPKEREKLEKLQAKHKKQLVDLEKKLALEYEEKMKALQPIKNDTWKRIVPSDCADYINEFIAYLQPCNDTKPVTVFGVSFDGKRLMYEKDGMQLRATEVYVEE